MKNLIIEEWRDVPGFDGLYSVSNTGLARRNSIQRTSSKGVKFVIKPRVLKFDSINGGYLRVTFSLNNSTQRFIIHRLVASVFLDNPEGKPFVNHIDGDKTNNRVENLEWCTSSENEKHSYNILGKINHNRKLSSVAIDDIRKNLVKGLNTVYFMEKYSVCRNTVLNCFKNKYYNAAS